jgi:hypothetical protein
MSQVAPIEDALRAARAKDGRGPFVGVIELYCESPACPTRIVDLYFKELDGPLPPGLACRRQLKLHGVQTIEECKRADEADARRSVNAQRWRREHRDELLMPLGAFLHERLP